MRATGVTAGVTTSSHEDAAAVSIFLAAAPAAIHFRSVGAGAVSAADLADAVLTGLAGIAEGCTGSSN